MCVIYLLALCFKKPQTLPQTCIIQTKLWLWVCAGHCAINCLIIRKMSDAPDAPGSRSTFHRHLDTSHSLTYIWFLLKINPCRSDLLYCLFCCDIQVKKFGWPTSPVFFLRHLWGAVRLTSPLKGLGSWSLLLSSVSNSHRPFVYCFTVWEKLMLLQGIARKEQLPFNHASTYMKWLAFNYYVWVGKFKFDDEGESTISRSCNVTLQRLWQCFVKPAVPPSKV